MDDKLRRYLRSAAWRRRREAAIARAGHCCEHPGCKRSHRLEVHHLSYERVGHELPEDLRVLCREHHREADAQRLETTRAREHEAWLNDRAAP